MKFKHRQIHGSLTFLLLHFLLHSSGLFLYHRMRFECHQQTSFFVSKWNFHNKIRIVLFSKNLILIELQIFHFMHEMMTATN